jgi:MFS family permease
MNATAPARAEDTPHPLLLAVVAFNQLTAWAAFYYAFSIFAVPMRTELAWSQQSMMGAFTVGLLGWAAGSIPVGMAIDRGRGRGVLTLGSVVGGVLFIAWSQAESLASLYAIWFAFGFVLASNLYDPAFAVITRSFGRNFHRAITTVTLVGGFASTLAYPLVLWLIELQGWRGALISIGCWHLLVSAPLHWWAIGRLEAYADPVTHAPSGSRFAGLTRALRRPVFWFLTLTFTCQLFVVSAVWAHMMPMLLSLNLSAAEAVQVVMWVGPTQVAGRVLQFLLMRYVSVATLGRVTFLLLPVGVGALLVFSQPLAGAYVFAFCLGSCNGIATIVRGTAIPAFIGKSDIGAVSGAMNSAVALMRAVAPFVAALMLAAGGYRGMLQVLIVIGFGSVFAFWIAASLAARDAGNSGVIAGR